MPVADAVTVVEPIAMPVTVGCVIGVVEPCGMVTLAGTVAMEVLLDASVTVTPPVPAGADKETPKDCEEPIPTVVFVDMLMFAM